MGRTATNVIGNSLATAVIAKWEGKLGPTVADTDEAAADVAIEPLPAALAVPVPAVEAARA
jgi:Na+/H+-dicarboxylate symporter